MKRFIKLWVIPVIPMVLPTIIVFSLVGCAQWNTVKVGIAATTQKAADESLQVVLWKLCKGTYIGPLNRWISGDKELADAYNKVCERTQQANVVVTDE